MVRALACGAEGPWIEITFDQVSEKLFVLPAANGYPTLFRDGEGLGGNGRGDGHHPSHAVHSDACGTLNFHCLFGQPAMGLTFTFLHIFKKSKFYQNGAYDNITLTKRGRPYGLIFTSSASSLGGLSIIASLLIKVCFFLSIS